MSPSLNSFGSTPSVSQLVWDTDLVIPDGKAIVSASGEVGIVGDVSISGNLATDGGISTDGTITGADITATENLVGLNAIINEKPLIIGELLGNGSVTLAQPPTGVIRYTSPDYTITRRANTQYVLPALTFSYYYYITSGPKTVSIAIQAKSIDGTYTTISQISKGDLQGSTTITLTTPDGLIKPEYTALRLVLSLGSTKDTCQITSNLTVSLTPYPIY